MKKTLLIATSILLTVGGHAQTVRITGNQIRESGGKVSVNFTAKIDKLKSNEKMTVTPVIYNGNQSKELKPIVWVGRNKSLSEKRVGNTENIRTRTTQTVPYTVMLPYEDWMGELSLRINMQSESCCTKSGIKSQDIVRGKLIRYDAVIEPIKPIAPKLSPIEQLDVEAPYLYPISEYTAITDNFDALRAEGALIIRFKQGRAVIDPTFGENKKSLDEVRKVLELIKSDPQALLVKIVLAGASSPEGADFKNRQLSQKRADALKNYLGEDVSSKEGFFETINIGEDWVGLRKMVEASAMQYKGEVLDIIDNVPVMKGREKRLMDLKWGRPYNYILEHFFPQLRSAGYIRIFYESKPSPDFTITNEAVERYNRREYKDALIRLEGVKPTATTQEIRGGCQMMLGEYDKAEALLNDAVQLGSTRAVGYLEQLTKLREVELNK